MSITQSIQTVVTNPAGVVINATSNTSDTDEVAFSGTIAATSTNVQKSIAFPYATLTSMTILSDQTIDMYTNATDGTGGNHLPLIAGIPFVWDSNSYFANFFTHVVTTVYFDNAGGTIANVKLYGTFH